MRARRRVTAIIAIVAGVSAGPVFREVRGLSLLARLADPEGRSALAALDRHPITVSDLTFAPPAMAPRRARLYRPSSVAHPPGVVLVHGVHRLGIDEPRMVRLARALAESGVAVLTPEIGELSDFSLRPSAVAAVSAAAVTLQSAVLAMAPGRVGVMGISFGGGLALMAAADPANAAAIGFVMTLGAYHDLERVLRFFATDTIDGPDGASLRRHAHDYGPLVLVLGAAPSFFPPEDAAVARDALRLWLSEDFDGARARAASLSPPGQARMAVIFEHRVASLSPLLVAAATARRAEAAEVSPSGVMARIRVPVFALHGADDDVIPPTEALWIAATVPAGVPREALVTSALGHAEMSRGAAVRETARLVGFLGDVLDAAVDARR